MTVLFVGLGSIGARHLKNLHAVACDMALPLRVSALRSAPPGQPARALPPEVTALLAEQLTALPENARYDVAFITGPTHLHARTIGQLKGRVGAFFIEKPLFESTDHDLDALGLGPQQKAYVAAPLRWTAIYAAVRQKLRDVPIYSVRAICSSYLPDWRPGSDYRTGYAAHAAMGGGVTLDLIHEWDYLAGLFGLPAQCYNLRGKFSHLEIDSDDLSIYIARYPGFLCEVHLDYFGRGYRRELEVLCEAGTLRADFGTGQLHLPDGSVEDHSEDANQKYLREMAWFLKYAQHGGENENSPRHALAVLHTALDTG